MKQRGFTFIEILVSVTIIAVLIAIGVASYASVNRRARDAKRKSDLEQVRSALEQYRADIGSYPTSGWSLSSSNPDWIDLLTPTYMDNLPVDPKNTGTVPPGAAGAAGPVYAYLSNASCGLAAGREFILATRLEDGGIQTTQYGTCTYNTAGWYLLGEQ